MKKAFGLAVALTLALSLSAAAEQTKGTVQAIDPADATLTLQDGTKLWMSEGQLADISIGDQVFAAYQVKGDKKVVTAIDKDWGPRGRQDRLNELQSD